MQQVRVGIEGRGVLASALAARVGVHRDCAAVVEDDAAVDVVVRAVPSAARAAAPDVPDVPDVPTVVPGVRQQVLDAAGDVRVAGFWGGLGSLLAAVATQEATDPEAVHVAYGFPGAHRLIASCSPSVREELLGLATDDAVARVDGRVAPEPLGEGRRLAWFPQPVGPAHAVSVGGLEHRALPEVPTVRTWVAARALAAEVLQAVGRLDPDAGLGAWLAARATAGGAGPGATGDVRWAVVAECLDADGSIVRAWANGTDPVVVAADLLLVAAVRLARTGPPTDGTVVGLGGVRAQLDAVADLRSLRWSVSRPRTAGRRHEG